MVTALVLLFAFTAGGVIWLSRDVNRRVSNRSAAQSIAFQSARSGAQQVQIVSLRDGGDARLVIDEPAAREQALRIADRLFDEYDLDGTVVRVTVADVDGNGRGQGLRPCRRRDRCRIGAGGGGFVMRCSVAPCGSGFPVSATTDLHCWCAGAQRDRFGRGLDDMIRQAGSRLVVFVRSLTVVILLVVGIPVVLIGAASARFGGGAPLHGVPSPADWEVDRITSALTDRLTEHTVADIVIRSSLIIAWAALVVLVFTIIAETVHMLRHDGLAMPDIRGLGLSQSVARVIAAGLLVVVPIFGTPSRALGGDARQLVPEQRAGTAATVEQLSPATAPPDNVWVVRTPADRAGRRRHTGARWPTT